MPGYPQSIRPWVKVPGWLRDERPGAIALLVYMSLADHASRTGRVSISQATLAEECGVTERTIRRCLERLRDLGAVTWSDRTFRQGPNRYLLHPDRTPVTPPTGHEGPHENSPTDCQPEENLDTEAPPPGEETPVQLEPTLDGMPDLPPPAADQLADQCRRVWFAAYRETHGPPDPTVARQAGSKIRQCARDRTDMDSWRALWRACAVAGREGRWNVADNLAPRVQHPAWNGSRTGSHELDYLLDVSRD